MKAFLFFVEKEVVVFELWKADRRSSATEKLIPCVTSALWHSRMYGPLPTDFAN